jgi:hypothetical protein
MAGVIAQHEHVGVEGARNAWRQQSGPGHHVQSEVAELRECRRSRRGSLPADDLRSAMRHGMRHDRHVTTRSVEMRLHDLQGESRRNASIEGVAAALQNAHADRGGDPMRCRDDAKGALYLGP